MLPIEPPQLKTLHTKPSWTNRAGRVDRSACCELTVRDARTLLRYQVLPTQPGNRSRITITVTASQLHQLHNARHPYILQGDRRTSKSNAMRGERTPCKAPDRQRSASVSIPLTQMRSAQRGASASVLLPRKRSARGRAGVGASRDRVQPPYNNFTYNPNAGACRDKILGLPAVPVEWSQTITLVSRSRLRTRRRTQRSSDDPERFQSHNKPVPTANDHFLLCPICNSLRGRVRKLFLPLCTEQEADDAHLAQCWLRTYDTHIRPHMTELYAMRNRIIERYSTLFAPRSLACRTCLGIRYGESKSSRASRRL